MLWHQTSNSLTKRTLFLVVKGLTTKEHPQELYPKSVQIPVIVQSKQTTCSTIWSLATAVGLFISDSSVTCHSLVDDSTAGATGASSKAICTLEGGGGGGGSIFAFAASLFMPVCCSSPLGKHSFNGEFGHGSWQQTLWNENCTSMTILFLQLRIWTSGDTSKYDRLSLDSIWRSEIMVFPISFVPTTSIRSSLIYYNHVEALWYVNNRIPSSLTFWVVWALVIAPIIRWACHCTFC